MLKIKWKPKKYNFTEQSLKDVLDQIAAVDSIAFSQKKEGSAFVIFKSVVDAVSDGMDMVLYVFYST
jgi:DnaJ family protein C protein 17